MKTKKLLVILFAIMMGVSVAAQANEGKHGKGHQTPEERAKKQTEMMKQQLQLNETQATQVEQINAKYAAQSDQLKQEVKDKMKAQGSQKNAELKAVLTPEQYAKLEQIRKDRKEQMKSKKEQMKKCMKDINATPAK